MIKENLHAMAEEKGIPLILNIAKNLPQVETDESKLHQVIMNVISNAIKFTKEGNVTISVKNDLENIFIEIKDTGIGISQGILPHIFDEFRQADGTSSRQFEGTGLGLAIANRMIGILGGNIKVNSKLGEGSVFTISVPIKWSENIKHNEIHNIEIKPSPSTKKTILVVDDSLKSVQDISSYLIESGYDTISASSGKEALKMAEKHQPYAITLDIIMPEMDGWEVLQKLKANEKTKNIPVIVVSVSDDRETGFALGAVGYINKPVDKKTLLTEINIINSSPKTIMIVDDNDFELNQIANIIKEKNINVVLAESGKKCLKLLGDSLPDILILDLVMPEIDGFMVLEEIRKNDKTKNLDVIIVTAKDLT